MARGINIEKAASSMKRWHALRFENGEYSNVKAAGSVIGGGSNRGISSGSLAAYAPSAWRVAHRKAYQS